jgi:predicted Zn-dependent protease with MMP-like domain
MMERKRFELLVHKAIAELPGEFRERLRNVAVIVQDNPSDEMLDEMEVPEDETLFGLYEGTPLTERGFFDAPLHPDRIWIFQEPIEDECETEEEIKEEIKITVVHEVAHFFGLDDDYLEDLGY